MFQNADQCYLHFREAYFVQNEVFYDLQINNVLQSLFYIKKIANLNAFGLYLNFLSRIISQNNLSKVS